MKWLATLTLTLILCFQAYTQSNSDLRIANKYAYSGQCTNAIEMYETFESKLSLQKYYPNYLKCLLEEKKYTEAITLVKKARNKYPNQIIYIFDLGLVYKQKGDKYRADKEFRKSLDNLRTGRTNDVNALASKFSKNGESEWLYKVYQRGQELNPNYEFGFQQASSLANLGQTEKMIGVYLDLIEKNPNNLNTVKIKLQNSLGRTKSSKDNYDLLRKKLLLRVQKTNNSELTELLIWLYIQSNEYDAAYIYTKALDKRLKENGDRMFDLAYVAYENKAYQSAIKCYQYIVNLGTENPYYKDAKISELIVAGEALVETDYTNDELLELDKNYQSVISELGQTREMVYLMKDYAKIKAFYLYDYPSAIQLLEKSIQLLDDGKLQAECKLMLGDILLITNEEWDAILLYSQVEKSFKENPIGHQAKYNRAKVSYYQGQFDWAQAQLDVLKASTTKLISNNAIKLSLFITDNLGLDTSAMAMNMYAKADLLSFQNKLDESLNLLDSMLSIFPGHTLTDDIIFKKADIHFNRKEYAKAAALYEKVATDFSYDILADDALFNWADLLENKLDNKEKAMEIFEKIVLDYSDSIYTSEARKRFRNLRGDENIEL
ncbi:MAG: tetratricopeptide repeat protein [Flavobacteriales bacterium]|nr:tetratricopeptide repeat protein [Flavobacteriales bacterium]